MKKTEFVYLMGMRFERLPDGNLCQAPAGRPALTGDYGEPTKAVRVPVSLLPGLYEQMEALKKKASESRPTPSNRLFTTPGIELGKVRIVSRPSPAERLLMEKSAGEATNEKTTNEQAQIGNKTSCVVVANRDAGRPRHSGKKARRRGGRR